MFKYEKLFWYPINIKNKDLKLARVIKTQYGGPFSLENEKLDLFNLVKSIKSINNIKVIDQVY